MHITLPGCDNIIMTKVKASTHHRHSIAHGNTKAGIGNDVKVIAAVPNGHHSLSGEIQVQKQRLQPHPFVDSPGHELQHCGDCLHHLCPSALQHCLWRRVQGCMIRYFDFDFSLKFDLNLNLNFKSTKNLPRVPPAGWGLQ